ncbi:glycosyltransferase [Pectobacterium versatile]|uniref:Glycosyltransferase n=1 Tax=Pectobacterium parvum TaxID=2778550 RepID=A0ABW8G2N3_9GAMM|nr:MULTISPECIES: glycosyltransferase [Pectobacterium]MBA0184070.1 glycosyltransferase [Pectobacterium versatile]POE10480.1 hypothetical protein BV921_08475 [Pectobacterium odoriferum]
MLTVLLAAYNGDDYIAEQINSIINSNNEDELKIIVSLDKSVDKTADVVLSLDNPLIELIVHDKAFGSAQGNFSWAISEYAYKSDYFMLSDQDDFWLKNKIPDSMNEIRRMEKKYGVDTPCLVFTDSVVVDENLQEIYDSFIKSSRFDAKKRNDFKQLIVQNVAQGCTFTYNAALAKYLHSIPKDIIMHDWWMILVASYFGKVSFLDKKTMLYRQHAKNEIGAVKFSVFSSIMKLINEKSSFKKSIEKTKLQAKLFLQIYDELIDYDNKNFLVDYSSSSNMPLLKRKFFLYKNRLVKSDSFRTLGLYVFF